MRDDLSPSLLAAIEGRRSIRQFTDEPLERADLERALMAATWAPSAGNRQDWIFSVVTNAALKREMAAAVRRSWDDLVAAHADSGCLEEVVCYARNLTLFEQAAVVIAVSARQPGELQTALLGDRARAVSGSFTSAAMAAENLLLALEALGLGACCLTAPLIAGDEIANLLQLGRRQELVCLIAVGHPAARPVAPARKPLTEVARFRD